MRKSLLLLGIFALVLPIMFLGCEGDDGAAGAPGTSTGTISGTVTNSATGTGLGGVTVSTDPNQGSDTTAPDGSYSLTNVPVGNYTLTFEKTNFGTATSSVSALADVTSTENVALIPTVPVLVEIDVTGTATPGSTLTASVTTTSLDDSSVISVEWDQKNSVTVTFDNTTSSTTNVTLPDLAAYKDELFHVIAEPPITPSQLPLGVEVPEEFPEQLQDRFGVQAIAPFELEEAGLVTLVATVTTTSGEYTQELEVHTELPWKQNTGIQNVAINVPTLLHGGNGTGPWDWSVTPSGATLDDATAQNPEFTATVAGSYTVSEANSTASFTVVAGTWAGLITGLGTDGRPESSTCFPQCHVSGFGAESVNDAFDAWRLSGHAEIFTNNLNTGGHYSESCFVCHTVGYDTDATNGGIDDVATYQAFLDEFFPAPGGVSHPDPDNFANLVTSFPNVAKLTNIQCENCHGPNNSQLHFNSTLMDEERASLASSVCGSCHGEPARHGRYQQWQVSPHANYELAIEEGSSSSCTYCHSANGFIAWEAEGFVPGAPITVTWDENTVHPQTCAACHDPHDVGTASGEPNNARVRVIDDTPLLAAGFKVLNAGRGAVCMVCHNTRRGLVNDADPGDAIDGGRAPHAGAQADVLMGQNAFFVTVGIRGKHSLITDTCSRCHMQETPPPNLLSYNQSGTNHTFLASKEICANCHNSITADEVQTATETQMAALVASLEEKLAGLITAHAAIDNVTLTSVTDPTTGEVSPLDNVMIAPTDTVTVANFADSHGRQAIDITVDDGVNPPVTGHLQLRSILVNTTSTILTIDADGNTIAKAGWNYLMATNERSHGIHNPTFTLQILAGAQAAVDGI